MGRNSAASAVPSWCLGQQAPSWPLRPVTSVMLSLAVICAMWNPNPASGPRGFIERYWPKAVSWIRSSNMLYLHRSGTYVILCTLFSREPRCNQQGNVSYGLGTRLRTLSTAGFWPGSTSKPVYNHGILPGHALTSVSNHYVPVGRHEVSHHGLSRTGTTPR